MSQVTTNFKSIVDQAVEKLPPVRKRIYQRLMRNTKVADEVHDLVMDKCFDEMPVEMASFATLDGFGATTDFNLDVDKLEKILELVFKYLPQIISLLSTLFR